MLTVKITGISEAVALATLPTVIPQRVLLDISQLAYDGMQAGAGAHTKTGALFASTFNRVNSPTSRIVGHDPQRAPYAPFLIFGTRAHEIRPKNRKALRWVVGNRFVFAKVVHHPGYRGDNYRDRVANESLAQLPLLLDNALRKGP